MGWWWVVGLVVPARKGGRGVLGDTCSRAKQALWPKSWQVQWVL